MHTDGHCIAKYDIQDLETTQMSNDYYIHVCVCGICVCILCSCKKTGTLPFVTMCMKLESIMLSKTKSEEHRQIPDELTHLWYTEGEKAEEQTVSNEKKPLDFLQH